MKSYKLGNIYMSKKPDYDKIKKEYAEFGFGDLGDKAVKEMQEEELEKKRKAKIANDIALKDYRELKKKYWTKEKHTGHYNMLDTDDNLKNVPVKKVTKERIDKEYNKKYPKLTEAEEAINAEKKWQKEFKEKQAKWQKETEDAQIHGNEWDDDVDYTYDAVAEWEADVAARTVEITSAEETNKLKSITLADANNMDIFETHASKSYPDHKYVLIGKSRIWIATNTVIEHNGEKVKLKPINFLGGKGKRKTNKKKRTNKKKTNKRRTNKRKTSKRKTSKRKTSKRKTSKRQK